MADADDDVLLFAGSASQKLGADIAAYLGCELGACETLRFSEGNLFVRVEENVRGRDVFLVQGTAFPANDNFMELLFWVDALKRASAASVTAVIPYFSYAKGDPAPRRSTPPSPTACWPGRPTTGSTTAPSSACS